MKSIYVTSLVAASFIAPAIAEQEDTKKSASDQIAGIYKIVSGHDGKNQIPVERLEGKVAWTENAITGYDENENKLYAATYELDDSAKPWKITMKGTMLPSGDGEQPKTFTGKGLVKIEDKEVTLIYSPKGGVPDDFEADEGEHKFVFRKTDAGE